MQAQMAQKTHWMCGCVESTHTHTFIGNSSIIHYQQTKETTFFFSTVSMRHCWKKNSMYYPTLDIVRRVSKTLQSADQETFFFFF